MKKKQAIQELIPDIERRAVILPIQCGQCLFHRRMAIYPKPCIQLGTPASAETCRRFVPDPNSLGEDSAKILRVLRGIKKPNLLAAVIMSAKKVERLGFELGQPVYLHVMGGEYISNYASGTVIGCSKDQIVVSGYEGYSALYFAKNLITRAAWLIKLKRMHDLGHINDPKGGLRKIAVRGANKMVAYEPEPLGKKATRRKRKIDQRAQWEREAKSYKSGGTTVIGARI